MTKRWFDFPIVNFPFICSNIAAAPVYGVYISQLIRNSRACGSYQDFLDRGLLLTRKLLNLVKLKSSLQIFYDLHHDLVDRYGISVSQMTTDMFPSWSFPHSWLVIGFVTRLTRRWNDTVMQVSSVCIKPDGQTPLVKWYGHASVFCVYQTRWPNPLSEMIRSYKCFLHVCIKPDVLILPLSQD